MLVANLTEMLDEKGGFKAPDTSIWQRPPARGDHGRAHGCGEKGTRPRLRDRARPRPVRKARTLPHRGVPEEVCDLHSKRAAEIEAECERTGKDSYRAKGVAARSTRAHKRHTPIGDLMECWQARDRIRRLQREGHPIARGRGRSAALEVPHPRIRRATPAGPRCPLTEGSPRARRRSSQVQM